MWGWLVGGGIILALTAFLAWMASKAGTKAEQAKQLEIQNERMDMLIKARNAPLSRSDIDELYRSRGGQLMSSTAISTPNGNV